MLLVAGFLGRSTVNHWLQKGLDARKSDLEREREMALAAFRSQVDLYVHQQKSRYEAVFAGKTVDTIQTLHESISEAEAAATVAVTSGLHLATEERDRRIEAAVHGVAGAKVKSELAAIFLDDATLEPIEAWLGLVREVTYRAQFFAYGDAYGDTGDERAAKAEEHKWIREHVGDEMQGRRTEAVKAIRVALGVVRASADELLAGVDNGS